MMLQKRALRIRQRLVKAAMIANTGHISSALSIVDLLTVLFFDEMKFNDFEKDSDRFVLSKGHSGLAMYSTLAEKEFIDEKEFLDGYHKNGSRFTSFPTEPFFRGLAFSSGSLGHGLSTAAGMAYGLKLAGENHRIFCLISDGECQEGATWEAALFSGHHKLSNLCVIVDNNGLQALGPTGEILSLEPFLEKWSAFGFESIRVNGHNYKEIKAATSRTQGGDRPICIVADTIKGKGISFMENNHDWHYLPITEDLKNQVHKELEF